MASTIQYTHCPFCNSTDFQQCLTVKDYTVSHENFEMQHCNHCHNRFTQNIATQEGIGRYYQSENYISHSDTKKGFISKIYHTVRKLTLVSKRNLIVQLTQLKKGNLLDVGAGTGAFVHTMQQAGWQVTALEPDATARSIAASKYGLQLQSPDELFGLPQNHFNAITLWHVLEHIHTLKEYLQQFNNILQQNGKLVIAVPNYTSYDASYYKEFWAGYDVPRHLYHFSPAGMKLLAKQYGFRVEKVYPMWFDSVYVSMLSEQYKTGKQNFLKALLIGFASNWKALLNKEKCSSVIYVLKKESL